MGSAARRMGGGEGRQRLGESLGSEAVNALCTTRGCGWTGIDGSWGAWGMNGVWVGVSPWVCCVGCRAWVGRREWRVRMGHQHGPVDRM